jgi:hypothetical protein
MQITLLMYHYFWYCKSLRPVAGNPRAQSSWQLCSTDHGPRRVVPTSPAELAGALRVTGYLADEGLATAVFIALRMNRPLFCEGEPGTGKAALAQAMA